MTHSGGSKNEALEAFETAPSATSLEIVPGLYLGGEGGGDNVSDGLARITSPF